MIDLPERLKRGVIDLILKYSPSNDYINNTSEKTVIVKDSSQLSGSLDTSVLYLIDGIVDMGTTQIEVPPSGLNISGLGFGISYLISSEDNYTMFTKNGSYAGNLFLKSLEIEASGTNSKVFDLDNDGNFSAVELETINFNNCTEIGTLTDYRQFLAINLGIFGCSDGLAFAGTWAGGARISTAIVRGFGSSGTVFKAGAGLTFNSRFITDINMQIPIGATGIDLSASNIVNDEGFQIINASFSGGGDYLPNIDHGDRKVNIKGTKFIDDTNNNRNTYVGAQWYITTEVATSITQNVLTKLAGTTTYLDEQWFRNTTDNAFIFDSSLATEVEIKGVLSVTGGNNNQIDVVIRHWDNSASSYTDIFTTSVTANGGAGNRAEGVSLLAYAIAEEDDRFEIWVMNTSSNNDITGILGGLVTIKER